MCYGTLDPAASLGIPTMVARSGHIFAETTFVAAPNKYIEEKNMPH
jgi:hypothetical protein